jgi:hypothetical protein
MSINIDGMQGNRLTVGILYLPVELPRPKLTKLYAAISDRYPDYESFTSLPDGAMLASGTANCIIQTGRLQLNEDFGVFELIQDKFVDVMRVVAERLDIRQFLQFGVKITATAPMRSPNQAGRFLEQALLRLSTEQLDRLGTKRPGAGLRAFVEREGAQCTLRVEPLLADQSQVFLEVDAQYTGAFTELGDTGNKIRRVYDYMFVDVKNFIGELRVEK